MGGGGVPAEISVWTMSSAHFPFPFHLRQKRAMEVCTKRALWLMPKGVYSLAGLIKVAGGRLTQKEMASGPGAAVITVLRAFS